MDTRQHLLRIVDLTCLVLGLSSAAAGLQLAPMLCALVPPLLTRLLWNRQTPPVFLACLLFQWLYTSINVYYAAWSGYYPGLPSGVPNVNQTMAVIMVGLLSQAVGFAVVFRLMGRRVAEWSSGGSPYRIGPLVAVSVAFAVLALFTLGMIPHGTIATFLRGMIQFRLVILALLVYSVLSSRTTIREQSLTVFAVAWSTVLCLGSRQSTFKEVILISLVAALNAIRLRESARAHRVTNRRILVGLSASAVALLYAGVLWESQIKPIWRHQDLPQSEVARIGEFVRLAASQAHSSKPVSGLEALLKRMNNLWQMSLVLQRVPRTVPHSDGRLTQIAVVHVLMPRILFPEKPTLDFTNRELAQTYLGIKVGPTTSVGIGYVTEFYVDFGIAGAFLAAFLLGGFLGGVSLSLICLSPTRSMGLAVGQLALWGCFCNYEANLAKALGSFLSYGAIFLAMGWTFDYFLRGPLRSRRDMGEYRPSGKGLAALTSHSQGPIGAIDEPRPLEVDKSPLPVNSAKYSRAITPVSSTRDDHA